ncbi:sarcosine oxidase subunit gamma [Mesobaculum littorinae]|uniref:Sarcosine oxidase subunit gamma n=1 Tax=Mesobaculum littorinae TaxID=2486419 RepID=A0A438AD68_9RHOB|nr:sarcosine oxidase subunit gamma [Mesobaculum littorinae]RVV96582.1 sarcosine oxidase subunit gamma [Mesobaculum littorinae]
MTDLASHTAFGAAQPRDRTIGALALTERPDIALASLTLRAGSRAPAPFGLDLPGPGGLAEGEGVAAFWSAPGQWMIEAPGRAESDFAAEVVRAVGDTGGTDVSVTEQTDGFVAFDIVSRHGPAPLDALLERLVNLDPALWGPGRATRTVLHHMSVFVLRRDASRVTIWGIRSAAGSLWHALDAALTRQNVGGYP